MSDFVNTVDNISDEALANSIIDRSIAEIASEHVTSIGEYAFYACSKLTTVDFPLATSIGSSFWGCSALTTVNLPTAKSIGNSAFRDCSALTTVDFPVITSIGYMAFGSCSALTTLILRSETVCTLAGINALEDTPIASGAGYIYVPAALLEDYKAAKNWSTYAAQFRALEDYTVDGTTTGELDPEKI